MLHVFHPDHYHRTLGPHPPVLALAPGDTIRTLTIDAGGRDHRGEAVSPGGNPQTGPFLVEGAEPGDTLVVRIDRMTPNRSWGYSGSLPAANVLDPWQARLLPEGRRLHWEIDVEQGAARLSEPLGRLGRLELPLHPMLGCFGVAPPGGQALSTATSAEHGGNMDYRGFTVGAVVYFPVFQPGALFHLGDGHAAQGDGEIVGQGIETTFEVDVTLDLQKGRRIRWPRGESATHLFTVGNARPLDQALQHATTEMIRWLEQDYGLDIHAAGGLLGQCVEYAVGNVFDPAYTMVCLIRKSLLPAPVRTWPPSGTSSPPTPSS